MMPPRRGVARAAGLVLGFAADRVFGDPQLGHPVAGFGALAMTLERHTYAPARWRGVLHHTLLVAPIVGLALAGERALHARPWTLGLATAGATWVVLGGRSLEREAHAIGAHLAAGDLPSARLRLPSLVGRTPDDLTAEEVSRAVIESVAENTSDAVVAPLIWGAVAGLPGLLGYRAVNTLDAMVGHRSQRYREFGWWSARFDDVANLMPARLSAVSAAAVAPVAGGSPTRALRTWRRDAAQHPSPNAGPLEAAFAGALGVRLGGTNAYGNVIEHRGELGDGPRATVPDVRRATRLARATDLVALAVAVTIAAQRDRFTG